MLQYCHDISNIKQYDDNAVNTIPLLSCSCGHTPNQIPQSLEINQKHRCNARVKTHTHTLSVQTCQVFFPRCWSTLSWRAGSHPFGPFSLNQWFSAILKQCDTIVSTSVLFPSSFQAFKRNKKAPLLSVSIKMPKR